MPVDVVGVAARTPTSVVVAISDIEVRVEVGIDVACVGALAGALRSRCCPSRVDNQRPLQTTCLTGSLRPPLLRTIGDVRESCPKPTMIRLPCSLLVVAWLTVGCGPASLSSPSVDAGAGTVDASPIPPISADGAANPSTLAPEEQIGRFCSDLDAPFCTALFGCCTDRQTLDAHGGTLEGCKATFPASCQTDFEATILPIIKSGATSLDVTGLAACAAKLDAMKTGGSACTRPPLVVVAEDCVAAFHGTIAAGEPCNAKGLTDMEFLPCNRGTCRDGTCEAFLPSGAACDPAKSNNAAGGCDFPDGEACMPSGATGQCRRRGIGADACLPGEFSCESMSCGNDGKCAAVPADACKGL